MERCSSTPFCCFASSSILNQQLSPKVESFILILYFLGYIGIIVPLVYLDPHGHTFISTTFFNEGQWSTQGLSFFVGLAGSAFAFLGE